MGLNEHLTSMIRGSRIHQEEQEEVENHFQFITNNIT